MRKTILLALLGFCACSETSSSQLPQLEGPNGLALAGRRLLVSNVGSAQLRALDLSGDAPKYERAPNPIFALALPTAPLPRTVVAATVEGGRAAPFAFALSSATSEVTVIAADAAPPFSYGSFSVPGDPLAAVVTHDATGTGTTTLWLALSSPGTGGGPRQSGIYELRFPDGSVPDLTPKTGPATISLGAAVPHAMALVSGTNFIVVGTTPEAGNGSLAFVDRATASVRAWVPVAPVNAPVLALDVRDGRLFGLLDCGEGPDAVCGRLFGLQDLAGAAPTPIGPGTITLPGSLRGVAIGAQKELPFAEGVQTINPLVAVSSSDGSVYFVDGLYLKAVRPATTAAASENAPALAKNPVETDDAPADTVTVAYEGTVPAAAGQVGTLETTAGSVVLRTRSSLVESGAKPGFRVELNSLVGETCDGAIVDLLEIQADRLVLASVPAGCSGTVNYSVRVPSGQYAVNSANLGFVGAVLPGAPLGIAYLTADGAPYAAPPAPPVPPGATYTFTIRERLRVSPTSLSLPSAVVYDADTGEFFATYQGGNAVLQIKSPLGTNNLALFR